MGCVRVYGTDSPTLNVLIFKGLLTVGLCLLELGGWGETQGHDAVISQEAVNK